MIKNPPANAGDTRVTDSAIGLGKFPEGGHGNPLQYSCLENPKKRNLEGYIVHGGYKRVEHLVTIKQQGHQEH